MSYINKAELKSYLDISGTGDDTLLDKLIDAAQSAIDRYTSRTFEASTDATRKFTVGVDTEGDLLFLDADLAAITSIITDADATSSTTLASTEYVPRPRNMTPYHAIQILGSSSNSWTYTDDPENGVEVTGRWAWSTTAPADVAQACMRLAGYYYRQKDAGVFDTTAIPDAGIIQIPQGMPRDVQLILNPYRRMN